MTNLEAADIIVEMFGRFAHLRFCSGKDVEGKFSEAVSLACMALKEKEPSSK